jgi:hypothetical protein
MPSIEGNGESRMHARAFEELIRKLNFACEQLVYDGVSAAFGTPIVGGEVPTTSFTRTMEGSEAESELIDDLLRKHKWELKWSEKFLRDRIDDILKKVVESRTTACLNDELKRLAGEFEGFDTCYDVLIVLRP